MVRPVFFSINISLSRVLTFLFTYVYISPHIEVPSVAGGRPVAFCGVDSLRQFCPSHPGNPRKFLLISPLLQKSTNILQVTNDLGGAIKEKDGEDDYPYYDFYDDDEDLMPVASDEAEEEEEEVDLDVIRHIVPEGYEILEVVVIKEEEEENDEGEKNGVESGAVKPIEVNAEADDL